jgi:ParB family chromosome partitioning protein
MKSKCEWMATNRPKTIGLFRNLFPGNDQLAETIGKHMLIHGYDESQPIIIWDRTKEEGWNKNDLYVVDGHTRLVAAKQYQLDRVYVARVKFTDEQAALKYAIHNQRDRRNMTDADILRCIEAVDKLKPRGGDRRSGAAKSKTSSEAIESGASSAAATAKMVGTSKAKVEKARTVMKHADENTRNDVLVNKKSIHRAYQETQNKRKGADTCKECGVRRVKLSPKTREPMGHGLCNDCIKKRNREKKNIRAREEFKKIPINAEAEKFWIEALPKLEDIFGNPPIGKVGEKTYKRISAIISMMMNCELEIMRKSKFEER